MLTVALISQKGGAGKTTLALNLAVASGLSGRAAAVIDLDPQASAAAWADSRERDTPAVVSAQASRLGEMLSAARRHGAALALIDTAPHAETAALAAARAADLVLVPCRPSILDLRAVAASRDIALLAGVPAAAVLCAVPARGPLAGDAKAALKGGGLPAAPCAVGQRIAFVHAMTGGLGVQEHAPRSAAAAEISGLHNWIVENAAPAEGD